MQPLSYMFDDVQHEHLRRENHVPGRLSHPVFPFLYIVSNYHSNLKIEVILVNLISIGGIGLVLEVGYCFFPVSIVHFSLYVVRRLRFFL